jgi:hypothetical protein
MEIGKLEISKEFWQLDFSCFKSALGFVTVSEVQLVVVGDKGNVRKADVSDRNYHVRQVVAWSRCTDRSRTCEAQLSGRRKSQILLNEGHISPRSPTATSF